MAIQVTSIGETSFWKHITSFVNTPLSTSELSLTYDVTDMIQSGMSLKYVIESVTYYGIIEAITPTSLTISGAPFSGVVTSLFYDGGEISQLQTIIPSSYEFTDSTALISLKLKSSLEWDKKKSYLVKYKFYSDTVDSGNDGKVSIRINNVDVCTNTDGLMLQSSKIWYSTDINIDTSVYEVNPDDIIEISCTKGTNGDASDLSSKIIFVTP